MATNGYARITAGVKLVDINPNKEVIDLYSIKVGENVGGISSYITIQGYSKISLRCQNTTEVSAYFVDSTGTIIGSALPLVAQQFVDIDIPSNAMFLKIIATYTTATYHIFYYSLLA